MGKLNTFYINSEQRGEVIPSAYFTDATEDEFKELLDNFLSENDGKFNIIRFTGYVGQNGYYIMTIRDVIPPHVS